MKGKKGSKRGLSRRDFIKSTAAGAGVAAAAGTGLLGGPFTEGRQVGSSRLSRTKDLADWEVPPPPIPASEIQEAVTADVIVVGAGIAGLTAAASAAEAGAKTILLEKAPTYTVHGLHNAAVNSRLQMQMGLEIDKDQIISTIMEFGAYRSNQQVVKLWADKSGEVMNWLLDMAQAAGIQVVLDPTTKPWYFPNYPTIHVFLPNRQATLAAMLENYAKAHGVDIRYETPAVQLLRESCCKGRVTGLLAQTRTGYVQFNATKAVVLCTGDYGADREMVEKYCDWRAARLTCGYAPPLNTGDGHKMGLWVGAAIDDLPHCVMYFDWSFTAGFFNLARQPWLYVNQNGERFMNEDLPWGYEVNQMLQQPGDPRRAAWAVWDAKYDQEWPKFQSQCCKNMGPPTYLWNPQQLTDAVNRGTVLVADTLDELAQKMQVPVETFKATAARYTELAKLGVDLDYGKYPTRLTTLEKPPYYACQMGAWFLVTLGGLKINTKLQVLDTEGKVIPGLYAAGNVSGSFFGNMYPTTTPGLSHGRAWTFGYLAGKNAAAEQL